MGIDDIVIKEPSMVMPVPTAVVSNQTSRRPSGLGAFTPGSISKATLARVKELVTVGGVAFAGNKPPLKFCIQPESDGFSERGPNSPFTKGNGRVGSVVREEFQVSSPLS